MRNLRPTLGLVIVSGVALIAAGCSGDSDDGSDNLSEQVAAMEKQVGQLEKKNKRLHSQNIELQQQIAKLKKQQENGDSSSGGGSESVATFEYEQFQSPSTHIACGISSEYGARCESDDKTWNAGPAPSSCNLDWGNGITVGPEGEGQILCAGDTVAMTDAPVLEYGQASEVGAYRCESAKSGMTCTNNDTGHGFKISKQEFLLF